jgi:nucleoside-diphosphate-sugar epimerase
MSTARRYIVTGGGGFVGKALCAALRTAGHDVLSLSRKAYPDLDAIGVRTAQVDIGAPVQSWAHLMKGYDGIFHTAAKVDMWGRYADFFRTNVQGTRNIIAACKSAGVQALVFTSSPSVVHTGKDLLGVDEQQPYPEHFHAFYPQTKAQAEVEVLAADDNGGLRTVALRPHLIWGPHDTNLVPTIVERSRRGKLTRIGAGANQVDLTYIEDCVRAHLAAMRTLEAEPDRAGGKAYFISQGEPVVMWQWIDRVLAAHGLPPVSRSIPTSVAMPLALVIESVARGLLLFGIEIKPLLTRFLVSEMATSHYFNINAAKRDLGYAPQFTIEEAMLKTFGSKV